MGRGIDMRLLTTTNTKEMEILMESEALVELEQNLGHENVAVHFEHGQWWAICSPCGASWSAVDDGSAVEGISFEVIDCGDGSCHKEED
jgi:hypothetical protein